MASTSLYKLSEQCKSILGKGHYQELIEAVKQAYASVVKLQFYENKNDGCSEVDGVFIFDYGRSTSLVPVEDELTGQYYITIPSGYLRLPHEMGITSVGFMKGNPFVRVSSGNASMWNTIKAGVLGGNQSYYVEGVRMYFPKMNNSNNGNILLKMAISLDTTDVDAELNIPPDVADQIIDRVVQKYSPKEKQITDNLI